MFAAFVFAVSFATNAVMLVVYLGIRASWRKAPEQTLQNLLSGVISLRDSTILISDRGFVSLLKPHAGEIIEQLESDLAHWQVIAEERLEREKKLCEELRMAKYRLEAFERLESYSSRSTYLDELKGDHEAA